MKVKYLSMASFNPFLQSLFWASFHHSTVL